VASDAGVEKAGSDSSTEFRDRQRELFAKGFSFSGYERDLFCLNLGRGKYLDVSGASGIDSITDGRGAVFGDFDDDGDVDVFLTTIQGPARLLFRNNVGSRRGYLRFALEGTKSGREAWGAVVRVATSAGTLTKVKACGSGYLSQSDPRLLFGLGEDASARWAEVVWPSGLRQRFGPLPARTSWKLVEGEPEPRRVEERGFSLPDPLGRTVPGVKLRPGDRFPDFRAVSLDGSETSLASALRPGRPTLVNFWATWCVRCRGEIPELVRLRDRIGAERLEVVGLSVDEPGEIARVREYVKERSIPYPVLLANTESIRSIYGGDRVAVPLSFLLDGEGTVIGSFDAWSRSVESWILGALPTARPEASGGR
jgi:peroxiredoxin